MYRKIQLCYNQDECLFSWLLNYISLKKDCKCSDFQRITQIYLKFIRYFFKSLSSQIRALYLISLK